jgi:hypothetical protein
MVGVRRDDELHRIDGGPAEHQRLGDAMHAIHDPSIRREDDREGQVGSLDQLRVHNHCPDGRTLPVLEPLGAVEFGKGREWDLLDR